MNELEQIQNKFLNELSELLEKYNAEIWADTDTYYTSGEPCYYTEIEIHFSEKIIKTNDRCLDTRIINNLKERIKSK